MRVEVTAEHIRRGKKNDCFLCPVALAVSGACGRRVNAAVRQIGVKNRNGEDYGYVDTPVPAQQFMKAFDRGEAVEPFAFDLDVPEAP